MSINPLAGAHGPAFRNCILLLIAALLFRFVGQSMSLAIEFVFWMACCGCVVLGLTYMSTYLRPAVRLLRSTSKASLAIDVVLAAASFCLAAYDIFVAHFFAGVIMIVVNASATTRLFVTTEGKERPLAQQ